MPVCEWPIIYPADDCACEPLSSLPASGQAIYEQMAADYLWQWTGRRYGLCEVTVRPCKQNCTEGLSTFGAFPGKTGTVGEYTPTLISGQWYNISCGSCGDQCGCDSTPALKLPGPVDSVEEIVIDGEVLAESAYRVDNYSLLVRIDGGRWPTCQNLSSDSASGTGAPGTWEVTYKRGVPVPVGGQVAAYSLACELAKAACGDSSCALPQRVQTITRQGVTVAMMDSFDDINEGHTGIWLIDSWIASVTKSPRGARVYSPDLPRYSPRRTTWRGGQ